jgi:hypothetical protein
MNRREFVILMSSGVVAGGGTPAKALPLLETKAAAALCAHKSGSGRPIQRNQNDCGRGMYTENLF